MGSLEVGPSAVRIWSWSFGMGWGVRGEGKETPLVVVFSLRAAGASGGSGMRTRKDCGPKTLRERERGDVLVEDFNFREGPSTSLPNLLESLRAIP